MGGFFFADKSRTAGDSRVIEIARKQFLRSGYGPPTSVETKDFVFDHYAKIGTRIGTEGANFARFEHGGFIASAGTFIYDGKASVGALRAFYRSDNYRAALEDAHGHFAIILSKNGKLSLWRDLNSSYEVFYDDDLGIASSSYLAIARAADGRKINVQEAYEYVFNGASFGERTPLAGVMRLDFGEAFDLSPKMRLRNLGVEFDLEPQPGSRSDLARANFENLKRYFSALSTIWDGKVKMGVSGGYDTRLMLSLFRNIGVAPHLFVYGKTDSPDFRAAERIAAAAGLPLQHINKALLGPTGPDDLAAAARENFDKEDGVPLPGILERDHERFARMELAKGGALHVHGGGGEVFRNFFNTPERQITPRQFVWSFYSAFDPRACTANFDSRAYEETIAGKVVKLLGLGDRKIARQQVEFLYPQFRCRSWFGRENSLNERYLSSVLPFYDYQITRAALQIPAGYKFFGNLEGEMIRLADPEMARQMSNYGHSFSVDAPPRRVASDWLTYLRPPFLRRYVYRVRTRVSKPNAPSALTANPYVADLVDPKFPYMSQFFRMEALKDQLHFSRICALECLYEKVGAK